MISSQDPYGLVYGMYPSYWPEGKKAEVRGWDRMRQIVEVLKYAKYKDVYKALSEEDIREVLQDMDLGIERAGDHWWKVSMGGGRYFFTDRRGMEEIDRLIKERVYRD